MLQSILGEKNQTGIVTVDISYIFGNLQKLESFDI